MGYAGVVDEKGRGGPVRGLDRGGQGVAGLGVGQIEGVEGGLGAVSERRAGRLEPGQLVSMTAFGSGFTWGSAVLRWG